MMTDCISLSPVISKAPIITSSPLKKPQYACKIALLEQLQRRHHNKRKLVRSSAADIKIADKKQLIHSKDNFSSYTFDTESAEGTALQIIEKPKKMMKIYQCKKRSTIRTEPNSKTLSPKQFGSPVIKKRASLPSSVNSSTETTPQSIEYSKRYKAVQKKWHADCKKQPPSPYYNKSPSLNRNTSDTPSTGSLVYSGGHRISVDNSITDLVSMRKTITCKRRLSFTTDPHPSDDDDKNSAAKGLSQIFENRKPLGIKHSNGKDNSSNMTRNKEMNSSNKIDNGTPLRQMRLVRRNSIKVIGTPKIDTPPRISKEEAEHATRVRRERIALKVNQRAQIYALNAIMRDLEETNFAEEMSSKV